MHCTYSSVTPSPLTGRPQTFFTFTTWETSYSAKVGSFAFWNAPKLFSSAVGRGAG